MPRLILLLLLAAGSMPAQAGLRVFACEPEWASLVRELGGEQVTVSSATTALQDPHHIQARPSLIARMRRAELVVCTGAELETGWLPVLLRRAANPDVQPGSAGYFEAARFVTLLDKPVRLDRAAGDLHAAGDPHIQTDPRNIRKIAVALGARLARLDKAHASAYRARTQDFLDRWDRALQGWQRQAARLKGLPVVTQHKSWTYLIHWTGMKEITRLEAKPGVPPSSAHLSRVLSLMQQQPARAILRAAYQPPRAADWLHNRTGIPVVVLPYTVGGNDQAGDLFGLFDSTLHLLTAVARD